MKLHISDELSLTTDAISRTFAVLGIRGAGKTTTIVDLVEEFIKARLPVCIIDPLDNWWGLRSSRDGKSDGLKVYIFGGKHADVPLEATGGEIAARFVVENRVPTILSMRHLKKPDQRHFVAEYGEALYDLLKDNTEPFFQVTDECARFLPQTTTRFVGKRGEDYQTRCLEIMTDLYSEARSAGFGGALIGQRPSRINKDVLSQCDVLVAMRTQGAHDRKALEEWVDAHGTNEQKKTFYQQVGSLPSGTGFYWDPIADIFKAVRFRERETFDSAATPKPGTRVITPKRLAAVDLDIVREKMAATIERAKANNPDTLRARIKELERQAAAAKPTIEHTTERVEVPTPFVPPEIIEKFQQMAKTAGEMRDATVGFFNAQRVEFEELVKASNLKFARFKRSVSVAGGWEPEGPLRREQLSKKRNILPEKREIVPTKREILSENGRSMGESSAPARMLQALAGYPDGRMNRRQLAIAATVPVKTSTFRNALSTLKRDGFIDVAGELVTITDAGRENAPGGGVDQQSVVAMWRSKFGGATLRMFDLLLEYPEGMTRGDLATAADIDVSTSTFRNSLSTLRGSGAVQAGRDGFVKIDEALVQ